MKDEDKNKEELINELKEFRQQIELIKDKEFDIKNEELSDPLW